jgi:anaerobic ribonucleoside-triphosphate reductase activating protein
MSELLGRIHTVNYESKSCGPLSRTEVFFQGCDKHCLGCFSPETWDYNGGASVTVESLVESTFPHPDSNYPKPLAISICGGEPLDQPEFLFWYLAGLRDEADKYGVEQPSILLYTGYSWEFVAFDDDYAPIMGLVDMVIAGPYVEEFRVLDTSCPTDFVGSSNQRLLVVNGFEVVFAFTAEQANKIVKDPAEAFALDWAAKVCRNYEFS